MLSPAELSRYARQIVLPELGVEGQERLRAARIAIVGAGGLGSPAALYLCAAGVGTLGIVDDDTVQLSNLHRQILHATDDVGRPKTDSARDTLRELNPNTAVRTHSERLNAASATSLFSEYDVVIDGSDNYPTRYAVNDACAAIGKTWIYGSVERYSGQLSVFDATEGPCYRCVFPDPPAPGSTQSCEDIGVLGAVPGVIGTLQALEALKVVTRIGTPLVGRLLQVDFRTARFDSIEIGKREDCVCAGVAREAVADEPELEPRELAKRLREAPAPLLLDVREPWEWSVGRISSAQLIPMGRLESEVDALRRDADIVVYCHHGMRSAVGAEWLRNQGFRARNLLGGIDRWSVEVDPTVPRY